MKSHLTRWWQWFWRANQAALHPSPPHPAPSTPHSMESMFLPGVESSPHPDSLFTTAITQMTAAGREYPQI